MENNPIQVVFSIEVEIKNEEELKMIKEYFMAVLEILEKHKIGNWKSLTHWPLGEWPPYIEPTDYRLIRS